MTIREFSRLLRSNCWCLGILNNGYDDLLNNKIQWVSNGKYKNKWFADPFILDYNDSEIKLLVEEFDYDIRRGRIARLLIDRQTSTVTDCKILLDLDTHLSFPMIWRENGKIYVCPENYQCGAWNMYEYDKEKETLTFVQQMYKEKLTDATLYKKDDAYYLLSTYEPTQNGNKLTVYRSKTLMGEYLCHKEYIFNENIARNAGCIFEYKGKTIRPAQECNNSYGHAIVFQEIKEEKGVFTFKEIARYHSTNKRYNIGAHTYNQYKDIAVIDVKGYRFPMCAVIINFLSQIVNKMKLK